VQYAHRVATSRASASTTAPQAVHTYMWLLDNADRIPTLHTFGAARSSEIRHGTL